jgi:uncharacterized OB-fold protein
MARQSNSSVSIYRCNDCGKSNVLGRDVCASCSGETPEYSFSTEVSNTRVTISVLGGDR